MLALDDQGDAACVAKVTTLLNEAGSGDSRASADLLPLVYEQLRSLAGRKMRQERPDLTLQATALVHEAYLRLVDTSRIQLWESRWHFFAAAAESMRRILVETARRRKRLKRGGELNRVDLDKVEVTLNDPPDELVALDEALIQLAKEHPEKAQLVNLRYFGGLTHEEAGQALGISTSTADRHWAYARAWLYRQMASEESHSSP
jgi:RNA polymerase sigma factor (TIGR02999 family)